MAEFAYASHIQVGEKRFRERYGLDFEDFQVGQIFKHRPGLTITQQDNIEESFDTLNQAMIHFDAHYASKTEWKKTPGRQHADPATPDRHDLEDVFSRKRASWAGPRSI